MWTSIHDLGLRVDLRVGALRDLSFSSENRTANFDDRYRDLFRRSPRAMVRVFMDGGSTNGSDGTISSPNPSPMHVGAPDCPRDRNLDMRPLCVTPVDGSISVALREEVIVRPLSMTTVGCPA